MSRFVPTTLSILLLAGCATLPAPRQENPHRLTTVLASEAPSLLQGEPLPNAELATQLAEYELARRGVDCSKSRIAVSYCDGVYTVSFHLVDLNNPVETCTVEIKASDSRILRMTATRRRAAPQEPAGV